MAACCAVAGQDTSRCGRWRGGCIGSGALLLLLPKCPMCIAAYLALFTGAGAATDLAAGLRPGLMAIFAVSLAWLTGRWVARRVRARWRERAAPGAG